MQQKNIEILQASTVTYEEPKMVLIFRKRGNHVLVI